jgi:hypothetical protein
LNDEQEAEGVHRGWIIVSISTWLAMRTVRGKRLFNTIPSGASIGKTGMRVLVVDEMQYGANKMNDLV